MDSIVLGGGCFWCVEAVFQEIKGIQDLQSGYAGGHVPHPSYREVCAETTGHAEVVKVDFDPAVISLEQILWIFWHAHDPTTLNRQGHDRGTQYRSIILYKDDKQRTTAEQSKEKAEQEQLWKDPIVTEIKALETFYPAEEYHNNYYADHPQQPYCNIVIAPKVRKVRQEFQDWLKTK